MNFTGYESYEEYRRETNRRTPHTEERHKAKLDRILTTLYQQKDYRALEMLMEFAAALSLDEDEDRHYDLYFIAAHILKASDRQLSYCKAILRPYIKR